MEASRSEPNAPRSDGQAAWGVLPRLLVLPFAIVGGLLFGLVLGACQLPHVVLGKVARGLSREFPALGAWADWAEGGPVAPIRETPGWFAIWLGWCVLYFLSAFTWAAEMGALLGVGCGIAATVKAHSRADVRHWAKLLKGLTAGQRAAYDQVLAEIRSRTTDCSDCRC